MNRFLKISVILAKKICLRLLAEMDWGLSLNAALVNQEGVDPAVLLCPDTAVSDNQRS